MSFVRPVEQPDPEVALLGALLDAGDRGLEMGHRVIDRALAAGLRAEYLVRPEHAALFELLVERREQGEPTSPAAIADELERQARAALGALAPLAGDLWRGVLAENARGRLGWLLVQGCAFSQVERVARELVDDPEPRPRPRRAQEAACGA